MFIELLVLDQFLFDLFESSGFVFLFFLDLNLASAPVGTLPHKVVALTIRGTNSVACSENSGNLRIHLNVHIPFISHLLMSDGYLRANPISESFSNQSVDDVNDVLAREFLYLLIYHR
jgi:hypothetical protein